MYTRKPKLYDYEPDMSFDEISRLTGIHRNTVYNIYVSAMVKVTRYLKRKGYETL